MTKFRRLKAEEIEIRPEEITEAGARLLLYKDARCDQRILDETVGPDRWMSDFSKGSGPCYCTISIKQEDGTWAHKEDAGAVPKGSDAKALASDAFKRACFQWGIGRELYNAPPINICAADANIMKDAQGNPRVVNKFCVSHIAYSKNSDGSDGEFIEELTISLFNPSTKEIGREVFKFPAEPSETKEEKASVPSKSEEPERELDIAKRKSICDELVRIGADQERLNRFLKPLNKTAIKELTEMEADKLLAWLNKQKSKQ